MKQVLFLIAYFVQASILCQNSNFNFAQFSQNTNISVCTIFGQEVCISSNEGFNLYQGLKSRIYNSYTHYMAGNNVQSPFFEDSTGRVWFTTYEALNYYNPRKDEMDYMFMISSQGDTLKENYLAFHLDGNHLYLKAGKEIFIVDVINKLILNTYSIDFSMLHDVSLLIHLRDKYIVGTGIQGCKVYKVGIGNTVMLTDSNNIGGISILGHQDGRCWIGDNQGVLHYFDAPGASILYDVKICDAAIGGLSYLSDSKLLLSSGANPIYVYDISTRAITDTISPSSRTLNTPFKNLLTPYVDTDSTLWIGSDGQGVFFKSLTKTKFKHYLGSTNNSKAISIIYILPQEDGTFVTLNRTSGILRLNEAGKVLNSWNRLPDGRENFTANCGVQLDENRILFTSLGKLYFLNMKTDAIHPLINGRQNKSIVFGQLHKMAKGKIVASCFGELMQEISLVGDEYSLRPYTDIQQHSTNTTYFKFDKHDRLFISNDEVSIVVFSLSPGGATHVFERELNIAGGITGLCDDPKSNAVYISNTQGLFQINRENWTFDQIEGKDNALVRTIYSVLVDDDGDLWLSTNNGLMKYFPATEEVRVFTEMDGIQAQEYNTHAYLKTADGHMLFGGVNGLNYFHPKDVRFSTKPAPVYISEILINDETDNTFRAAQYIEHAVLEYSQNTISFEFHAIDYADPQATRVKYQLEGVDNDYVESKSAQGFARYANLDPGTYTLKILGMNSDGTWNESPKMVAIRINPPFYLTWWFIALSSLTVISLLYWTVRSYYRSKLEKKNQLLREQALIIKNQQAIEHERTRIASEMHDDLGSGLTTIRYLSDKALMQAKDTEEVEQIQRIADHSNTLVRNMSEIIWAMNSRFDDAENLAGYLRRYASEYLEEHSIPFSFEIDDDQLEKVNVRGEVRRNLFLVFKEVLHNTVKYSGATEVIIHLLIDDHVTIQVSEVGARGFDPISSEEKGNGLYNIKKRMDAIQGRIVYERSAAGMDIIFSAPIHL